MIIWRHLCVQGEWSKVNIRFLLSLVPQVALHQKLILSLCPLRNHWTIYWECIAILTCTAVEGESSPPEIWTIYWNICLCVTSHIIITMFNSDITRCSFSWYMFLGALESVTTVATNQGSKIKRKKKVREKNKDSTATCLTTKLAFMGWKVELPAAKGTDIFLKGRWTVSWLELNANVVSNMLFKGVIDTN